MAASHQLRQHIRKRQSPFVPVTALLFQAFVVAGCGGGVNLAAIDDDPSLITGSIDAGPAKSSPPSAFGNAVEDELKSDRDTVIGMVIATDLQAYTGEAVSWRNATTGASGTVQGVRETTDIGVTCRQFTIHRQTYQGAALWTAEICRRIDEDWKVTSFQKV
ncbi:RT0821/Lpp0805 family surface protein [Notoacmeibacter sp. MSK16QG-6]|nr:RT0821/Lpp0805 family surface protein [Notoacmeibacter sp. MSK16QG-6]